MTNELDIHSNNFETLLYIDNILVETLDQSPFYRFSICDFGFASLVGQDGSNAPRTVVSGLQVPKTAGITARYAAPELFVKLEILGARLNTEIDKKIDVFAYSMILYETLTRQVPWSDIKDLAEIKAVVTSGERPALTHQGSLNSAVSFIVEKGWTHSPYERPSFDEILQILSQKQF